MNPLLYRVFNRVEISAGNSPLSGENPEETRLDGPLDDYLLAKSKANETGNYRRNAERVLGEFLDCADEQEIGMFDALDVADLEAYALSLNHRTTGEDGVAATTARKYYDYVRAEDIYFQDHKYPRALHGQALLYPIKNYRLDQRGESQLRGITFATPHPSPFGPIIINALAKTIFVATLSGRCSCTGTQWRTKAKRPTSVRAPSAVIVLYSCAIETSTDRESEHVGAQRALFSRWQLETSASQDYHPTAENLFSPHSP